MLICRACLSEREEMVIFDDMLRSYYNSLTNLKIKSDDGLPQHACLECYETIQSFIVFKLKCAESESHLVLKSKITLKEEKECVKNEPDENFEVSILEDQEGCNSLLLKEENLDEINFDDILCAIKVERNGDEKLIKTDKKLPQKQKNKRSTVRNKLKNSYKARSKSSLLTKSQEVYEKKNFCGLCNKNFESTDLLNMHLENHKKDKACGLCKEEMTCWPHLLAHRLLHLPKKGGSCHICAKKSKSYLYLEQHYMLHHYDGKIIEPTCKKCFKTYKTPLRLRKHINGMHPEVSRSYVCNECGKRFIRKGNLNSHMKIHVNRKSYTCDMCDFKCNFPSGLVVHKTRRHTPTKSYCSKCLAAFVTEAKRNEHQERCKQMSTICMYCGKNFRTQGSYRKHMRAVHLNQRPFKCTQCPAAFKYNTQLKIHTDKHNGVKTQKCEYCSASFFAPSVLIKHRRMHTGEKPYVCKICNKGFTGNNNLKVHMKVHGMMLVNKKDQDVEADM